MINIKYSIAAATSLVLILISTAYAAQDSTIYRAGSYLSLTQTSLPELEAAMLSPADVPQCFNTGEPRCPDLLQPQSLKASNTNKLEMSGGIAGRSFQPNTDKLSGFNFQQLDTRNSGSPQGNFGTLLPHLKIDVIITAIEATMYAIPGHYGDTQAHFTITGSHTVDTENSTADRLLDYIPLPIANDLVLYNRTVYSGVVLNGCSSSTLIQLNGEVDVTYSPQLGGQSRANAVLDDSTLGYGYFSLQIFVLNERDGLPEYIIYGEVPVYCTNDTSPSAIE